MTHNDLPPTLLRCDVSHHRCGKADKFVIAGGEILTLMDSVEEGDKSLLQKFEINPNLGFLKGNI